MHYGPRAMRRLRPLLWPVLFCLTGLVLAHHETVLHGFAFTQSDLGDTRFNNYVLEHGWRWLTGQVGHQELWSPPFFYPAKNVLAYSDPLLGSGPPYWLWRVLGSPPDTAFQLWVLTVGALNFLTAYLLFRQGFRQPARPASAGAALFAFAGSRINQTMHHQLFPHFWSMLCLLAVAKLFSEREQSERARMGWIWLAALSAAFQLWAGFYLGFFLALGLTVALAWAMAFGSARRAVWWLVRAHPFTLLLAAATSGLVVAPMAQHFLLAAEELGMRSFGEALSMIPSPRAWLHLGQLSWWYGWMSRLPAFQGIPMEHEQRVGFGLLTSALSLFGLWAGRKHAGARLLALSAATLLLLATLFGDFTAWKWVYQYFPGARAIRAVARIGIFLLIPIGLGLSQALSWLAQRGRPFARAALALGALALLEQGETTPAFDKEQNRRDLAQVAKAIPEGCEAFLFSAAQGYGPYWKYQLDGMWAGLERGVPSLNGYSGNAPPGWPFGGVALHGELDERRQEAALQQWARAKKLDPGRLCHVKVGLQEGPYAAQVFSVEVPASLAPGARFLAAITVRNLGRDSWTPQAGFRLGSQSPQDNRNWGGHRVELPQEVPPGAEVTFRFEGTAPAQPGSYSFQWRMLREGVRWFGELSPEVKVRVEPGR